MTIIANLDAEIEQFYASQGQVQRELQIFGRVWRLIPAMTSVTLAPLMQIQAAAQMTQSGLDAEDAETRAMLFQFLGGVNDILSNVIHEDERDQFRLVINERGFPLGILDKVIEAIMQAFDAAPFDSGMSTAEQPPTTVPAPVSSIESGNLSGAAGGTSTPILSHTPPSTAVDQMLHPPVPASALTSVPVARVPVVAEWGQEPTLPPHTEATALIPQNVQDIAPPA